MSEVSELKALIKTLVESQGQQIKALTDHMESLVATVQHSEAKVVQKPDPTVSANGAVEQCRALEALSNMLETFVYDEENGLTFESWYNRFRGVITVGGAGLDDKARVELVLMRLETSANALYRYSIAPQDPSAFSFDDTISKLKTLFNKKISLLRTRWNCLNIQRRADESLSAYGARVNQEAVNFDLKGLTEEHFKVLIFILGLQDAGDKSIRARMMNMQDKKDGGQVTLQSLIVEAERILQIERDTAIGSPSCTVQLVHGRNRHHDKPKKNSPPFPRKTTKTPHSTASGSSQSTPRTPCWKCGSLHYVRDCPFAGHVCTRCQGTGHKEGYCNALGNSNKGTKRGNHHRVNMVTDQVHQAGNRPPTKRLFIDVLINGVRLSLQLDTGSDVTIISRASWELIGSPTLSQSSCRPVDCQGNALTVYGEVNLSPQLNGKTISERCIVAKCNGDLFGLEWIRKFGLLTHPIQEFCNKVTTSNQVLPTTEFIKGLQSDFAPVFSTSLGRCEQFQATLHLKADARPVFRQKRPVPYHTMALISEELERLEQSGIISPVQFSLFAAPIVVVKKANGSIRICGDYSTGLNDVLEPHEYPIPSPELIFASLSNAKIFTQLDLSEAYLQVEMDADSRKLLTIHTHKGLFVFNRLCPGVKPAAGIFQQMMETLLAGIVGVIIYFDDILVASPSMEIHQQTIVAIMQRLLKANLRLRFEKCHFIRDEVRYLGVIINKNGQRPDPGKVEAIVSMPPPTNVSQARSFLGAIGFYGRFIESMSTIRAPIDKLMRKDVPFNWTRECQEAFTKFKKLLLSDLFLTHYDPSLPIMIAADASNTGIGCVAYHTYPDQSVKAFYHASRRLTSAEQKYSQIEKEGLGIVFAVKKFHKFIWGRRFTIFTDHRPLLTIFGSNKGVPQHTANRLQRWAVILMCYDFQIKFIGTDDFGHADILSRLIADQPPSNEDVVIGQVITCEEKEIMNRDFLKFATFSIDDIRQETAADDELQQVMRFTVQGWPLQQDISSRDVKLFYRLKDELSIAHDVLLFRDRTVVPASLRQRVLRILHDAHPGMARMKALARCYVYWPCLDSDIKAMVSKCAPCQQAQKAPTRTCLSSWPTPTRPWFRAHADFAGPINSRWYLIVVDAYSKWPEVFSMSTTTTSATISVFREIFARHGSMEKLVTDNGPQWRSVPFAEFCTSEAVEHITTAPYMPMSNGLAERFVDTFKRTTAKFGKLDNEAIQRFLRAYRTTPNDRAPGNMSPAEVIYGRRLRMPLSLLLPPTPLEAAERERDEEMEAAYNRKHGALNRFFVEGEEVQFRQKPGSPWKVATVIESVGKVMYNVMAAGRVHRVHANQMRLINRTPDYLFDDPPQKDQAVTAPAPEPPPQRKNWRLPDRISPVQLRPRRK